MDGESCECVSKGALLSWRKLLKDNRRSLMVDLNPTGAVKIDMRLLSLADEEAAFDRIDVLINSVKGLNAATVRSPKIAVSFDDALTFAHETEPLFPQSSANLKSTNTMIPQSILRSSPTALGGGSDTFNFNASCTLPYSGQRAVVFSIFAQVDWSGSFKEIGRARYDLMETRLAKKEKCRSAGKLFVLDIQGKVIANLIFATSLWDTRKRKHSQSKQLQALRKRRQADAHLLTTCSQQNIKTREVKEARGYLTTADKALTDAAKCVAEMDSVYGIKKSEYERARVMVAECLGEAADAMDDCEECLQIACCSAAAANLEQVQRSMATVQGYARDVEVAQPSAATAEGEKELGALMASAHACEVSAEDALAGIKNTRNAEEILSYTLAAKTASERIKKIETETVIVHQDFSRRVRDEKNERRRHIRTVSRAPVLQPFAYDNTPTSGGASPSAAPSPSAGWRSPWGSPSAAVPPHGGSRSPSVGANSRSGGAQHQRSPSAMPYMSRSGGRPPVPGLPLAAANERRFGLASQGTMGPLGDHSSEGNVSQYQIDPPHDVVLESHSITSRWCCA